MHIKILLLCLIILTQCTIKKKDNVFVDIIKPHLNNLNSLEKDIKILVIANDACRNCSIWMLENNKKLDCKTILIYDTLVYGKIAQKDSCHKIIETDNDIVARISFPNISGHRIYWVSNNEISKVKEINSSNADSIYYFLSNRYIAN